MGGPQRVDEPRKRKSADNVVSEREGARPISNKRVKIWDQECIEDMRAARDLAREAAMTIRRARTKTVLEQARQAAVVSTNHPVAVLQGNKQPSTDVVSIGSSDSDTTSSNDDSDDTDSESSDESSVNEQSTTSVVEVMNDHPIPNTAKTKTLDDSGYDSAALHAPAAKEKTDAPRKLWAVRVGWLPGIYYDYSKASAQIYRYPHNEIKRFESQELAQKWLSESGRNRIADARVRPKDTDLTIWDSWTEFLNRTWDRTNSVAGLDEKNDIFPKLRYIFELASEAVGFEVDWSRYPLPQQLIIDERRRSDGRVPRATGNGLHMPALRQVVEDDSSSSEDDLRVKVAARICDCGPINQTPEKTVQCANRHCKVGVYHAACVGLGKRPPTPHWRCIACRPRPPQPDTASGSRPGHFREEPTLSREQAAVVQLILSGQNVCYTGSAGSGKSTVLKAALAALKHQRKRVDIVAPSGIAALAVGDQTTFMYAGWTPETFKLSLNDIGARARGKLVRRRLCKTDVLIVEEVSMVDSHVFQRLDRACREARDTSSWDKTVDASPFRPHDKNLPFGGIQIVVTGDFCQLPPVKPFKFCLHCETDELPG